MPKRYQGKTQKVEITAKLERVQKADGGKFKFTVTSRENNRLYRFLLTREKAILLADSSATFPKGVNLRLKGRISKNDRHQLNHVSIHAVDGHDVQSWAQSRKSPGVSPDVLKKAEKAAQDAEDAAMRNRAAPDAFNKLPEFKSPQEAYDKAMYILRRQVKLADPKLSKAEVWAVRDAINMLKGAKPF